MKIISSEVRENKEGAKHRRITFATNVEELKLLKGIVEHYTCQIPKNIGTAYDHSRLKNMKNEFTKFFREHNKR